MILYLANYQPGSGKVREQRHIRVDFVHHWKQVGSAPEHLSYLMTGSPCNHTVLPTDYQFARLILPEGRGTIYWNKV